MGRFLLERNGDPAWIQFEFLAARRVQSVTVTGQAGDQFLGFPLPSGELQSSADGRTWTTLTSLPGPEGLVKALPVRTYAVPATTARYCARKRCHAVGDAFDNPMAIIAHLRAQHISWLQRRTPARASR